MNFGEISLQQREKSAMFIIPFPGREKKVLFACIAKVRMGKSARRVTAVE